MGRPAQPQLPVPRRVLGQGPADGGTSERCGEGSADEGICSGVAGAVSGLGHESGGGYAGEGAARRGLSAGTWDRGEREGEGGAGGGCSACDDNL